ncbi:MAG: hypothetical protein QM817_29025 [Archangium sp.]
MRAALLITGAFLALAGCSTPPPPNCCGTLTSIARATDYTATIPSTDGGVPTTVKVNVASNGNTTLTFEQGGKTIVQAFTGVAGP